jgi:nicotinamidase-related amidase
LQFCQVNECEPGEHVTKKQHYGAYFEAQLGSLLEEPRIRNLLLVGFDSPVRLRVTVADALCRGCRATVLRDGVGTLEFPDSQEGRWAHLLAIRYIETCVGYTATSEDFVWACMGMG